MQRIPIVENVFCHTHKHLADPDSSDSSRLYPNEQSNSMPTNFLLSATKEVFTSKIIDIQISHDDGSHTLAENCSKLEKESAPHSTARVPICVS